MLPLKANRPVFSVFLWLLALLFNPALAKENRWTHYGLRPLAMGNVFVSIADDHNALFYNPAGLARVKKWDGEFFNPYFEVSENSIDFIQDASSLTGGDGISDILDIFSKHTGKTNHIAFSVAPHIYGSGWGFGLSAYNSLTLVAHEYLEIDLKAGADVMVPLSLARNFMQDRLSLGATVKILATGGVDEAMSLDKLTKLQDSDELQNLVKSGYGLGADFGLLFTPTDYMKPTLGVMISDIGGTPYQSSGTGGTPAAKQVSLQTGVSLTPYDVGWLWVRTSVEAHQLNHPMHYSKKFNLGAEVGLGSVLKAQLGLRHGLLSSGVELDVGLVNLRLITYAVDHGAVVGQHDRLVDRRYALQFKFFI